MLFFYIQYILCSYSLDHIPTYIGTLDKHKLTYQDWRGVLFGVKFVVGCRCGDHWDVHANKNKQKDLFFFFFFFSNGIWNRKWWITKCRTCILPLTPAKLIHASLIYVLNFRFDHKNTMNKARRHQAKIKQSNYSTGSASLIWERNHLYSWCILRCSFVRMNYISRMWKSLSFFTSPPRSRTGGTWGSE